MGYIVHGVTESDMTEHHIVAGDVINYSMVITVNNIMLYI